MLRNFVKLPRQQIPKNLDIDTENDEMEKADDEMLNDITASWRSLAISVLAAVLVYRCGFLLYNVYGGRETSEIGGSESRRVSVPLPALLCLSLPDLRLRTSL